MHAIVIHMWLRHISKCLTAMPCKLLTHTFYALYIYVYDTGHWTMHNCIGSDNNPSTNLSRNSPAWLH